MENDLLYRIAISLVPGIGDIQSRILISSFGEAERIFKTPAAKLEKIDGIGKIRAGQIRRFKDFHLAEKEIRFIEKHSISALPFDSSGYPKRLLHCYDAPALLYFLGTTDLNAPRIVSVVGTRNNTEYGKDICENFITELSEHNVIIVSGLAYGIDTIAHRKSLQCNVNTVAALAHGLDRIYPASNRAMAREMIQKGGLLSDFPSGTKPDKQNFPKRNRIVAGICDCLVVIQTGIKGGSIITANLAGDYHKDVFAFPGRITDSKSEGCNYLIGNQKAELLQSAEDLLNKMNWNTSTEPRSRQVTLFPELDENEKTIVQFLTGNDAGIDALLLNTKLSYSQLAATLLSLEMKMLITSLPGKIYKLKEGLPRF